MKIKKLAAAALSFSLFAAGICPAAVSAYSEDALLNDDQTEESGYKNQRYENEDPNNTTTELLYQESLIGDDQDAGLLSIDNTDQPTLNGIDISHWQNGIDISKLDTDFIIVKASGGKGFKDPSFRKYAEQILSQGKLFGFYHFARDYGYKGTAVEEAEFFYEQTKDYIGKGIPILDWETDLELGPQWVKTFLDRYYELSGVKCLVYMSASYCRDYDWTEVVNAGHKLWVAQYHNYNGATGYQENPWLDGKGTGAFTEILMHQYTSQGKLDGYGGNLDLNKFYGTKEDWLALQKPYGDSSTVYRLYNPNTGEHVYTASYQEYKALVSYGWSGEGKAWTSADTDGIPVHRLYNPNAGDHHYSTDTNEITELVKKGWNDEGTFWYAADESGVPVHRLYNPNAVTGTHHFTTDDYEKDVLVKLGWKYEGAQFYAVDENAQAAASDLQTDQK